ncbi:MAG: hypothetical protein ACT4QG_19860 [Sporichthyaceae bacterium]
MTTTAEDRLWHVTVTVAGPPGPADEVKAGLERLSVDHPFLMSARYACDRAEVRYWEEADDVGSAVSMAEKLWNSHRESAGLPRWSVVGLEVVDRDTHRRRGDATPLLSPGVRPF